jgi:hypothetical protein
MTPVCRACARVNPPEARYCYHDGVPLDGHATGSIAIGGQLFRHPFVFPSGRSCRNFDELVLACDTDWRSAQALLRQGYFESFLSGLGRADLARLARQYAREPDADRALDQFLGVLPSSRRDPPRLHAQPLEVNLGQLRWGQDHRFVLQLENQGMGLLHGTIAAENTPWLALGDSPGIPHKLFQCHHDLAVPVHIVGKCLRAASQPQEGYILIDSSGGSLTVEVRVEVPVTPFPEGALAGVVTPRQIAEKAKLAPREAAVLFEQGLVAAWYERNGWTYPVQGPSASGLGAVQQFFEALGLVTPPRVEINTLNVNLRGPAGRHLEYELQVRTVEKRPVFAHATTTTPWLQIGRITIKGQTALIPVRVPAVPALPGDRLRGKVQVTGNGNQRFTVEVTLTVEAGPPDRNGPAAPQVVDYAETLSAEQAAIERAKIAAILPPPPGPPPPPRRPEQQAEAAFTEPVWALTLPPNKPAGTTPPVIPIVEALAPLPSWPPPERAGEHKADREPAPVEVVPAEVRRSEEPPRREQTWERPRAAIPVVEAVAEVLPVTRTGGPVLVVEPAAEPGPASLFTSLLRHTVPLVVLVLLLLGVLLHDYLLPATAPVPEFSSTGLLDPDPFIAIRFHDDTQNDNVKMHGASMRFGLVMLRAKDPTQANRLKRLTFDEWGRSNNTCLRIDGKDFLFGEAPGRWLDREVPLGKDDAGRERDGLSSTWVLDGPRLQVTQVAEVVAGEQSRILDTCLVRYTLENRDDKPHRVGIRFLLDTFIGANDGVPFTIPGSAGLCDTLRVFRTPAEVPDYIQALEKDDLRNPGTVAHVQFRVGSRVEPPGRVILGGWPHRDLRIRFGYFGADDQWTLWKVPEVSMRELHQRGQLKDGTKPAPDSAVTMYWEERELGPGEKREVGFSYGLGNVSSGEGEGRLLLTVGGRLVRDGTFTLTALVQKPRSGEELTLTLPDGFKLLGDDARQQVPAVEAGAARQTSTVTWRIQAGAPGPHKLSVQSNKGAAQTLNLTIRTQGVFD